MSDTSAYDDYDAVTIPLPSSQGVDKERAQGYLSQHRARSAKAETQFDAIMKRRAEAVEQARAQLDTTIATMRQKQEGSGFGQVNLPLLSLAAGLLSPAPPGTVSNFGQELGRGLSSMGSTIRAQRMSDTEFQRGIAELQQKSAQMGDKPLADEAAVMARREIAGETNAAGLERALIKADASGGPGKDPADIKKYQEWLKDPKNAGKTFTEYREWSEKISARSPASLQELEELRKKPGMENATLEDLARIKATGREVGKSQGEVAQTLPSLESTVEQMTTQIEALKKHPGLPKMLGLTSVLPNIPGGDSANATALLGQLQGQAFLLQFEKLRGAGAITDIEGKKATDALAALGTAQSEKQFRQQLDLIDGILRKGIETARKRAGPAAPAETPPMPGAKKAGDGKWYVEKEGKFFEVRP